MILPLMSMFYLSFTDWGSLVSKQNFVGFAQYQKVLTDPIFWAAFQNTAFQVVVAVPVMTFAGLMLAYYLNLRPRGVNLLRVLFFTPALMSISAKSMLFLGVFSTDGLLNFGLRSFNLESWTTTWLANEGTALNSIIAIDIWSGIGFTAVLLAVRLSGIPQEIFEAAEIDGAGHWRKIWNISYPVMKDYFGGLFMLQFLWTASNSAALVLLLTSGGPGTSTYTLSYLAFSKAFLQQSVGYSQVAAVSLFLFGVIGMLVIRRIFRSVV
tara:strand:+ start:1765 stop:2565 length:801 start_codon:yes stop_codon:yes gene_type:complete